MRYVYDPQGNGIPDLRNAAHGVRLLQSLVNVGRCAADRGAKARNDHRHPRAEALAASCRFYARTAADVAQSVTDLERTHVHGADCPGLPCRRDRNISLAAAAVIETRLVLQHAMIISQEGRYLTTEARPPEQDVKWYRLCEMVIIEGTELALLLTPKDHEQHHESELRTAELDTARDFLAHIRDEIPGLLTLDRPPEDMDSPRRELRREATQTWRRVMAAMDNLPPLTMEG